MKYTVRLDREEYYLLLGALYCDADRLESLARKVSDDGLRREITSMAEKEKALRSKIIDTRKVIV